MKRAKKRERKPKPRANERWIEARHERVMTEANGAAIADDLKQFAREKRRAIRDAKITDDGRLVVLFTNRVPSVTLKHRLYAPARGVRIRVSYVPAKQHKKKVERKS